METIEELYEKVKGKLEKVHLKVNNHTLVRLVRYVMEVVEETRLNGNSKKEYAMRIIRRLVDDAPIDDDDKKICLNLIDSGVISDTIELIVLATKGEMDVNKTVETGVSCCLAITKIVINAVKKNKK